jgi:hypothetical protein
MQWQRVDLLAGTDQTETIRMESKFAAGLAAITATFLKCGSLKKLMAVENS